MVFLCYGKRFLHFCDWWSDGTYGEMTLNGITSVGTWYMITLD